jgi:hypothetical protein
MTQTRKHNYYSQNEFFAGMIKAAYPDATPEYRFHPQRRWRFDWYIPSIKVAVEIEGGAWIAGRHNRPIGYSSVWILKGHGKVQYGNANGHTRLPHCAR